MTTPSANADIRIYTIQDATQTPTVVSPGFNQSTLFVNLDENNPIYLSYYKSMQAQDATSIPLPPLGCVTLTPIQTVYALCDDGLSAQLLSAPPGAQWSPSPAQIGAQLSGLAAAIAEAIYNEGINLVAAPVSLYSTPSITPIAGAGPVGATTDAQGYNTCLGTNYDKLGVANYVNGFLTGAPALKFQKIFLNPGTWYLTAGQIPTGVSELITAGCQLMVCVSPNPVFSATEFGHMQTTLKVLLQAGANIYGCAIWQEPNTNGKFASGTAWGTVVGNYAGALVTTAGTVPFVACFATNSTTHGNYQEYFQAIPGTVTIKALTADFYGSSYFNAGIFIDTAFGDATLSFEELADNAGIPLGLTEWGVAQHGSTGITETEWITLWNKVLNFFLTRLNNGKTNGPISWYSGTNSPEYNLLPNLPCLPANSQSPGYDVTAGLNEIYMALSSDATVTTIAPGASTPLPPVTPSPNAGYAIANGISYDIFLNLTAGASSTNPFVRVRVRWYNTDDTNARPVDTEQWVVPMGNNAGSGTIISGKGPQRGQYMAIVVINDDTVACKVQCQVNSTSRAASRDVWRWDAINSVAVPGFTLPPNGAGFTNCLGAVQMVSVPANGSKSYLFGLYPGQAWVRFGTSATSPVITVSLTPMTTALFDGASLLTEQLSGSSASSVGDFTDEIILPRSPCLVTFSNSDSSAHNVFGIITTED